MYTSSVGSPAIMVRIVGVVVVLVEVEIKVKLLRKVDKLNMVVLNAKIGSLHSKLGMMLRSLPIWL